MAPQIAPTNPRSVASPPRDARDPAVSASASRDPGAAATTDSADRIVFFDGICVFCNGAVRWLVDHDPDQKLHFASLQGETAAYWRSRLADSFPVDIDTVVLLDLTDEEPRLLRRSRALLEIASLLPPPIRYLASLRIIPARLADVAYRLFAALRYRVFGKHDACPLPSKAVRARSLP